MFLSGDVAFHFFDGIKRVPARILVRSKHQGQKVGTVEAFAGDGVKRQLNATPGKRRVILLDTGDQSVGQVPGKIASEFVAERVACLFSHD